MILNRELFFKLAKHFFTVLTKPCSGLTFSLVNHSVDFIHRIGLQCHFLVVK